MSTLGFLSDKLDREQSLLQTLNEALLGVQALAVGRAQDLGYSSEQLNQFREILIDFVARLRKEMDDGERVNPPISMIVRRLKEDGRKPIEDWKEDLAALETDLKKAEPLSLGRAGVLEELLSILDVQLTKDFSRLYSY